MVTWGAKELLKNTINTATFHNRILEENEMWKQWEKECGLTMMVSDDDILKKYRKSHQCSKHRKKDKSREREIHKATEMSFPVPSSSKSEGDRWDHSGFKELYPDEDIQERRSSSHSSKSHSSKPKKKKKRRRKSSTSDNEIWEEFKKYKRSKKSHHKSDCLKKETSSQSFDDHKSDSFKKKETSSQSFDNHVKEWKRHRERK